MRGSLNGWAALIAGTCIASAGASHAQSIPDQGSGAIRPGEVDCTEVNVDFQNDPSLTREERIALMDQALMRSLSKYDACQTSNESMASAEDGGAGTGGGAGSAGKAGSTASSDMSGMEPVHADEQGDTALAETGSAGGDTAGNSETTAADSAASATAAPDNGKVPEDIPPADNDTALEAQIRQAAMNEPDPLIRERLWNEYRRYKGLPVVE